MFGIIFFIDYDIKLIFKDKLNSYSITFLKEKELQKSDMLKINKTFDDGIKNKHKIDSIEKKLESIDFIEKKLDQILEQLKK